MILDIVADGTEKQVNNPDVKLVAKGGVKKANTTGTGELVIYLPVPGNTMVRQFNGEYFVKGSDIAVEWPIHLKAKWSQTLTCSRWKTNTWKRLAN